MKTHRMNNGNGVPGLRSLFWAAVFAFACLWLSACGQSEPTGQAAKFAADVDRYIKLLSPKLIPLMRHYDNNKLDTALKDIYRRAAREGKPLPFALALLDKNGMYVTGRYPMKGEPEGAEDVPSGKQGYGSYQAVKDCLKKQEVTRVVLYWEQDKYYAICAPLVYEDETAGVLILAFGKSLFDLYPGLTEKQFNDLDLDAYRP